MTPAHERDIIRRVRLEPYARESLTPAPTWTLTVWDCYKPYRGGPQWQLGYELTQHDHAGKNGKRKLVRSWVVFAGEDFGCSPLHGIDSDAAVASILGFLTLRPGGTDDDCSANYTPAQMEFAEQHGELLSYESMRRFDKENLS